MVISNAQRSYSSYPIYFLKNFKFSENRDHLETVEDLIRQIEKRCYDCYLNEYNEENWFTMVCSKPHCVVWAKVNEGPFEPAKVMSVNEQNEVHVCFFGDHQNAIVPADKCFLYSYIIPERTRRRSSIDKSRSEKAVSTNALNVSVSLTFIVNLNLLNE